MVIILISTTFICLMIQALSTTPVVPEPAAPMPVAKTPVASPLKFKEGDLVSWKALPDMKGVVIGVHSVDERTYYVRFWASTGFVSPCPILIEAELEFVPTNPVRAEKQ